MRVLPGTDFEWDGREGIISYVIHPKTQNLETILLYLTKCITGAKGDLRTAMWESAKHSRREYKITVRYLFKKDNTPKEPVYRHECPKCHHRY